MLHSMIRNAPAMARSTRLNRSLAAFNTNRQIGQQARRFSEKAGPEAGKQAAAEASAETAVVLTPYQKVAATAQIGTNLAILGLVGVCGYFITKELLPTRMNPNTLFNEAVDQINESGEVQTALGTPIRGYGRDHGGRREGRRNFIENVELKDKAGNPRLRIKFNLQGPYGHAFGFAEVKKGMKTGEWVYLMIQMSKTGQVITLVDNRRVLEAETPEEADALAQLMGGSSADQSEERF